MLEKNGPVQIFACKTYWILFDWFDFYYGRRSMGRHALTRLEAHIMKLGSTALAIAALGIATPAHAVGYCSGIATNAASYGNGDFIVRVSWRNDWVKVCNLIQAHGNVSPQTCFAWFSVINNSMSYNKTLTVYYPSITDADCATMLTYDAAPVPGYVMMNR